MVACEGTGSAIDRTDGRSETGFAVVDIILRSLQYLPERNLDLYWSVVIMN